MTGRDQNKCGGRAQPTRVLYVAMTRRQGTAFEYLQRCEGVLDVQYSSMLELSGSERDSKPMPDNEVCQTMLQSTEFTCDTFLPRLLRSSGCHLVAPSQSITREGTRKVTYIQDIISIRILVDGGESDTRMSVRMWDMES